MIEKENNMVDSLSVITVEEKEILKKGYMARVKGYFDTLDQEFLDVFNVIDKKFLELENGVEDSKTS